jgi:hypothetical protein
VNNGNFIAILELLGRYDEITREHSAKLQRSQLEDEAIEGSKRSRKD